MNGRILFTTAVAVAIGVACPAWGQLGHGGAIGDDAYLAYPAMAFEAPPAYGVQPVAYQSQLPTPADEGWMAAQQTPAVDTSVVMETGCGEGCGAGEVCGATCGCGECDACRKPKCTQFFLRGWLDQGFTGNPDDPKDSWNVPMGFNDRANEYQLSQLYLSFGRAIRRADSWDYGVRCDLMYGSDYRYTQALGLETFRNSLLANKWNAMDGPTPTSQSIHGLAMPQLYAEFYAPWGDGVSVKMGHFYSIMGYESVMAPNNFFYSHSYTLMYGEPKTHTGLLSTIDLSANLRAHAGFTRGWDIWEPYVGNDKLGFLGGLQWSSCDKCTNIAFTLHSGDEPIVPSGVGPATDSFTNRTSYSLVVSRQLTQRLQLAWQHDLGVQDDAAFDSVSGDRFDATYWSFSQYAYYRLAENLTFGVRYEYFKDDKNTRVLALPDVATIEGDDYTEVTLGLNWKPYSCLNIRPEARWDWSGVEGVGVPPFGIPFGGMYHDREKKEQFTLSIDAVLCF